MVKVKNSDKSNMSFDVPLAEGYKSLDSFKTILNTKNNNDYEIIFSILEKAVDEDSKKNNDKKKSKGKKIGKSGKKAESSNHGKCGTDDKIIHSNNQNKLENNKKDNTKIKNKKENDNKLESQRIIDSILMGQDALHKFLLETIMAQTNKNQPQDVLQTSEINLNDIIDDIIPNNEILTDEMITDTITNQIAVDSNLLGDVFADEGLDNPIEESNHQEDFFDFFGEEELDTNQINA